MKNVPRAWLRLAYTDPGPLLAKLRDLQESPRLYEVPLRAANLRLNSLRTERESRQAALFCYGMSQRLGLPIRYAMNSEQNSDIDAIAVIERPDQYAFCPIQLKELVPSYLNATASLQGILDSVQATYTGLPELVLAVHLNREESIVLSELRLPNNIAELWLFGSQTNAQISWILVGNLLTGCASASTFMHPGRSTFCRWKCSYEAAEGLYAPRAHNR
jgi:hypothetical protein